MKLKQYEIHIDDMNKSEYDIKVIATDFQHAYDVALPFLKKQGKITVIGVWCFPSRKQTKPLKMLLLTDYCKVALKRYDTQTPASNTGVTKIENKEIPF